MFKKVREKIPSGEILRNVTQWNMYTRCIMFGYLSQHQCIQVFHNIVY